MGLHTFIGQYLYEKTLQKVNKNGSKKDKNKFFYYCCKLFVIKLLRGCISKGA